MLTAQQAFTLEIDDIEAAVSEISEQLDLSALKTNSLGFISCPPAFVESGVVAALQEMFPFDLVGQTSIATSTPGSEDFDQLSILVLTAEDVSFSVALSEPIDGSSTEELLKAYAEASSTHEEKPVFIMAYVPLLLTTSGDFFVNATDEASGGVPFFGSLAVDDTIDYHKSRVIFKGEGYGAQAAYILFYGDVQPRFYRGSIVGDKVVTETGVVTASEGSQLQSINDAPPAEYLKGVGVMPNDEGEFIGINSYPYMVDYNDGNDPVIRAMFAVTPDGFAVCGGDIPVGATLWVNFFSEIEILQSSEDAVNRMIDDIERNGANAIIAFSCIGRYFNLNFEVEAEAQLLHDELDSKGVPYTFTYSAGEICPVSSKDDATSVAANRAHNCTMVAVVL